MWTVRSTIHSELALRQYFQTIHFFGDNYELKEVHKGFTNVQASGETIVLPRLLCSHQVQNYKDHPQLSNFNDWSVKLKRDRCAVITIARFTILERLVLCRRTCGGKRWPHRPLGRGRFYLTDTILRMQSKSWKKPEFPSVRIFFHGISHGSHIGVSK